MATSEQKPLDQRPTKELRAERRRALKVIDALPDKPPRGKGDQLIAEARAAMETVNMLTEELGSREADRRGLASRVLRSLQGPEARALAFAGKALGGEMTLVAGRLDEQQAKNVVALVNRFEELEPAAREQLERLVGVAAGDPEVFAKRRERAAAKLKIEKLTEEAHRASVPLRTMYEEPGSVTLPAFVFSWLANARDADWTVADTGALVAVLGMFHNRKSLFPGGHFEGDVLVVHEDVDFPRGMNPHHTEGGSGQVNARAAMSTLARNGWLHVEGDGLGYRIRLGGQALKLHEGRTGKAA